MMFLTIEFEMLYGRGTETLIGIVQFGPDDENNKTFEELVKYNVKKKHIYSLLDLIKNNKMNDIGNI